MNEDNDRVQLIETLTNVVRALTFDEVKSLIALSKRELKQQLLVGHTFYNVRMLSNDEIKRGV